ncbi:MAG: signal peptidase II [Chloroflexota bacterium]
MEQRRRPWISPALLAMGTIIVLLDQATKYLIVQYFADKPFNSVEIVGDLLRFTLTTNRGSAFGLMQEQRAIFILAALVVVPAIFYFYRTMEAEPWFVRFSMGLLLGGTLGNFVDRARTGTVVDFIDMGIGNLRWFTYNVSDSSFVIGTIVLGAYILFWQHDDSRESQPGDAAPHD